MRYWVFENGDVVGPFPLQELMEREGFGPHSLVCPESQGEESAAWREAASYDDFHFETPIAQFASPVLSDVEKQDVFEEELNTLLEEKSPIISPEQPVAQEPAENLHFPAHAPAKPGPIEDYFNNIKGEDLGNILGIPDPSENSDMNLARALKSQFAQTQPPSGIGKESVLEDDPFDAFTAKEDLSDKQGSLEDDLAGVEPITQQVPIVLAGQPQEEPFHPKYRIRKKRDENADVQEAPVPPQTSAEQPGEPETPASQEKENILQDVKESSLKQETQPVSALVKTEEPQETPAVSAPVLAEEKETAEEVSSVPLSHADQQEEPTLEAAPLPNTLSQGISLSLQEDEALSVERETPSLPEGKDPSKKEGSIPLVKEPQETPSVVRQADKDSPKEIKAKTEETFQPQTEDKMPEPSKEAQIPVLPADQSATAPQAEPAAPKDTPPAACAAEQKEKQSSPVLTVAPEGKQEAPAPNPEPEKKPEPLPPAQEAQQEQAVPAQPKENAGKDPVNEIFKGAVAVTETPEVKEPIKEVAPVVETQVNRVKPSLKKTAEIDKFLNEKIKEEKSRIPASKKLMWASGFLAVILALLGLLWLFGHQQAVVSGKQQAPSIVQEGLAVEELMPDAAPDVPSAQEVLSAPSVPSAPPAPKAPEVSPQDTALQVVKNYELPNSNGKIADYFDRIYKSKLADGYNAVWSATRLHNNVYIVKYRISKTRLEPVVYLFQVDVSTNKLIGALNNITLDLVGKLN